MSPHLFTHLFYEGVIVSTRKLVYDAGASEDAIKALMQAQHKAVLKDLKIHTFDDKIDVYLKDVPGLEPREANPGVPKKRRANSPAIEVIEPQERAGTEPGGPPIEPDEPVIELSRPEPAPAPVRAKRKSAVPAPIQDEVSKPRTQTAERTSRASQFRSIPPPEPDSTPVVIEPAATIPTPGPMPPPMPAQRPGAGTRAATPPPIPARSGVSKTSITLDSAPEIEIIQHDDDSARLRGPRDTAVDHLIDDGVPSMIGPDTTIPSDQMPAAMPTRSNPASRPPSHGAATLPAVRQPSRPAVTPPSVVARPVQDPSRGGREDSQAIEIYSPSPPSVDPPPGEGRAIDRPGQYSMSRRKDIVSTESVPLREHTGRVAAIPSGLARPRPPQPAQPTRTAAPSSPPIPSARPTSPPPSDGIPQAAAERPPTNPAPPQQRPPHLTAPISSRTATGAGASAPSNVVMTRPAVIVGAPPKQIGGPTQRVRKAREDEGRGFGQGLISEKSLDEVILAYLSEDADEK